MATLGDGRLVNAQRVHLYVVYAIVLSHRVDEVPKIRSNEDALPRDRDNPGLSNWAPDVRQCGILRGMLERHSLELDLEPRCRHRIVWRLFRQHFDKPYIIVVVTQRMF